MATTRCAPGHRLLAADPDRHHELGTHAAWYVVAGVVTTGVQAVLFLLLRDELGSQVANLVAIALTTIGNTEFHRRVTFAGRQSNAGKRHLQDLLTFAFYAGYGSAVLAILDAVVDRPTSWEETGTLLLASLVGGFVRFAVLRWWVFAHRTEGATVAHTASVGAVASEDITPHAGGSEPDYRFTLANERTFLAWLRTALGLLAGGVAVHQLVPAPAPASAVLAGLCVVLAAALAATAYPRWRRVQIAMRAGEPLPRSWMIVVLTGGLLALIVAAAVLLVVS